MSQGTAYGITQPTIDIKKPTRVLDRDPNSKDRGSVGDLILNKSSGNLFALQTVSGGDFTWTQIEGAGGLSGTNYRYVMGNGTASENATELQNAYDEAKADTPAADNRWTIVVGPGEYDFDSDFAADTDFISVASLTGQRDVIFTGSGGIDVTANNATFTGINTQSNAFKVSGDDLSALTCKNCEGGSSSFGTTSDDNFTLSGTFVDCEGDSSSFGTSDGSGNVTLSGTFINCTSTTSSFGVTTGAGNITISGELIHCSGGGASFATTTGAGNITISGVLQGCDSGNNSFGHADDTDSTVTVSGRLYDCKAGSQSFGRAGAGTEVISGELWNCKADANSFGDGTTITGKLLNCHLTSGTFGSVGASDGVVAACIDGNQEIVNDDQSA